MTRIIQTVFLSSSEVTGFVPFLLPQTVCGNRMDTNHFVTMCFYYTFYIHIYWPLIQKFVLRSLHTLYPRTLYGWSFRPTGPRGKKVCSGQGFYTERILNHDLWFRKLVKVTAHPLPIGTLMVEVKFGYNPDKDFTQKSHHST